MIVHVHAVDHEVHGVFAPARRVESERSLAAQRRRQKAILRRRHRSRNQQRKVDEMPAIQRNLLHRLLIHHLPQRHVAGLHHRRRRLNLDRLARTRNVQCKVLAGRRTHRYDNVADRRRLHPRRFHFNGIIARRQRRRRIQSRPVRLNHLLLPRGRIGHRQNCARQHGPARIGNRSLNRTARLSKQQTGG